MALSFYWVYGHGLSFLDFLRRGFLWPLPLIGGVSFIDDVRSLPDSVRLVAQFIAMVMMFYQLIYCA